ncbi:MAG: stage III sporulation protein AB [Clostridia bacterium]|nr:stage III sporulation protein AB [Clostridia bacterium]
MRYVGAALIFIASVLCGVYLGEKKKAAHAECEAFLELFRYARSEISLFYTPTKLIWRGFDNKVLSSRGFLAALASAEEGAVYFDAFTRAFDMTEKSLYMSAEAKNVVRAFGSVIGKSDGEEQLARIDALISDMTEICKKAKGDAARDAKLYLTVGFSLGAAIFILLI